MHSVPMLFVADVESTSQWYQSFIDIKSGHDGREFEMLVADKAVKLLVLPKTKE